MTTEAPSAFERIILFSIRQRWVVLAVVIGLAALTVAASLAIFRYGPRWAPAEQPER